MDYRKRLDDLFDNSRFYILASSLLISIIVAAWLRIIIPSDQLASIRIQQLYGLLSIGYLYLAIIVSPLGYVIGKQHLRHLAFARRAIGVSAAYFAVLHVLIALYGQLGGLSQIIYLPTLFKVSLAAGLIAVVILLALAATSFDSVIKRMTFARWKMLHRLIYIGGILAVFHIWTIGTHLAYSGVRIAAFVGLAIIGGLEIFRLTTLLVRRFKEADRRTYFGPLFMTMWAVFILILLAVPSQIQNYHSQKHSQGHNQR